ncbi:MAG: hypothetical protein IJQ74_04530 [Synergistaceae bacterium]|nr:hypothetical protein [Synergistaceae bacterium]
MKKFLTATLIAIVISTAAFGATSNDVYLRQDVFEAKMDAFMAEIRLMNEQTRSELRKEIQDTKTELNEKIQANTTAIQQTNARIDVTNARLESLITMVYWGIALLGILITLAAVAPSIVQVLKGFSKSKITLEDVERLIDAKLQAKNAQGI